MSNFMGVAISSAAGAVTAAVILLAGVFLLARSDLAAWSEIREAWRAGVFDLDPVDDSGGMIAFFDGQACPTEFGWQAYPAAAGRYLVAVAEGGQVGATVGQALTDGEDRPVGRHSHVARPDGGHSHDLAVASVSGEGDNVAGSALSQRVGRTGAAGSHEHQIDAAGRLAGTNAPYIQLIACRKGGV